MADNSGIYTAAMTSIGVIVASVLVFATTALTSLNNRTKSESDGRILEILHMEIQRLRAEVEASRRSGVNQ